MERLPLIGGSYLARSIIASPTRCINYYPELNPKDALVPMTYYQRPGLVPLASPSVPKPARGLWQASNGNGYCVIGDQVFQILPNWTLVLLGTLQPGRTNPTSATDNGTVILLVDGSNVGYTIELATGAFDLVNDPTGIFLGADRVDTIDSFVVWNMPGTDRFGSTLSGGPLVFDATQFASKADYPDPLQTLIVNRHELLLLGLVKSEIWYDAGNPTFPFAELPGAYIEHGIAAKYSIAATDISVLWLGRDLQGQGVVFRQRGYQTTRISNHALERAIRLIDRAVGISDAIGYCYQIEGHVFYTLTFPAGDETWVFDDSIADPMMAWHQEAWTDQDGQLRRHRGNCCAAIHGRNLVGDWENGTIYEMDLETYSDTVAGIASPLTCIRTFPHIGQLMANGQPVSLAGQMVQFSQFVADIECGNSPVDVAGRPAMISLRWSDDRGKTFGQDVLQSSGELGQYLTQPQWPGLGIARDRIFELSHSIAGAAALNGAWIRGTVLGVGD